MSNSFRFKQFEIKQEVNAHKVGTDSMLLGAWTEGDFSRILDIGTGTGILALMMAQKFPKSSITAIDIDLPSVQEANENFQKSIYSDRIMAVHSGLQEFGAMQKFDLIISNPPYFQDAFKSLDPDRNRARHTDDLPVHELYEFSADLLDEKGKMNIVIPFECESEHIERAFDNELFVERILHTISPDNQYKRSIISYSFVETDRIVKELIVKDNKNRYSPDYINLTRDFYLKNLNNLS